MTKIDTYTIKGVKKETLTLPSEFDSEVNLRLIAQALRVYEDGGHVGLRKTKTRAEVNRTTKKLYKQKGTGGARHGSRKAPIFVGGGIAHGPRPLRRVLELPNKIKRRALSAVFASKAKDGSLIAISGFDALKKTNELSGFMKNVGGELKLSKFTFVLSDKNKDLQVKTRNLGKAQTYLYKDINAHNVFFGGIVVLDDEIFEAKKEAKPTVKKVAKKEKNPPSLKLRRAK